MFLKVQIYHFTFSWPRINCTYLLNYSPQNKQKDPLDLCVPNSDNNLPYVQSYPRPVESPQRGRT